jgi:ribonuclease P protein component
VLPVAHRLTAGDGFRRTVRSGCRAGTHTLVAHVAVDHDGHATAPGSRVGFVVSKAVGNAVVRNRVKRRLRHLVRGHLASLEQLPRPVVLVVRALPPAAGATYAELGADLGRSLGRCINQAFPSLPAGDPTTARTR